VVWTSQTREVVITKVGMQEGEFLGSLLSEAKGEGVCPYERRMGGSMSDRVKPDWKGPGSSRKEKALLEESITALTRGGSRSGTG